MITKKLKVKDGRTLSELVAHIQKLTKPMTPQELISALNDFTEVKVTKSFMGYRGFRLIEDMTHEDIQDEAYRDNVQNPTLREFNLL